MDDVHIPCPDIAQKHGLNIDYVWIHIWLVVSTPLKTMKVSWDYDIPN